MKKKYVFLLIALILFLGLAIGLGSSYAYWQVTKVQTETNTLTSNCFSVEFLDNNSKITLTDAIPVTDEVGMTYDKYTFTIKNTCSVNAMVDVNQELLTANTLSNTLIKSVLDDNDPVLLTTATDKTIESATSAYKVGSFYLKSLTSQTHTVGIWVDASATPENANNKIVNTQISVVANAMNVLGYLNSYVESMSGTLQGDGMVVNEKSNVENAPFFPYDYKMSQYEYFTVSDPNNPYPTNMFQWDENTTSWSTANLPIYAAVGQIFNVSNSGYYQICFNYEDLEGSSNFYLSVNDEYKSVDRSNECVFLGYLNALSDTVSVNYSKFDESNASFYLQGGYYSESLVQSNDYRFEGKDPNNYVLFNNELWRMIGSFDVLSHGIRNTKLVKIIRDEDIENSYWNQSNNSDWSVASLQKTLNGDYYNRTGLYASNGLNIDSRNMVENVTWFLGGIRSDTSSKAYTGERGNSVWYGRPIKLEGKIGLIYPSDYGYSVLENSCPRTTKITLYNSVGCFDNSWIFNSSKMWTLSPPNTGSSSDFDCVAAIWSNGLVGFNSTGMSNGVRPSLYLKAGVKAIIGNGSKENPYILGM